MFYGLTFLTENQDMRGSSVQVRPRPEDVKRFLLPAGIAQRLVHQLAMLGMAVRFCLPAQQSDGLSPETEEVQDSDLAEKV